MASDVDGSDPRMVDLMTFWPWLQMSTKPIPSQPIQAANPAPNIGFDIGSNTESNEESSIGSNIKPILNPSNIESNAESNIESNIGKRFLKAYVQVFPSRKIMTGDLYHLHFLLFN